MAESPSAADNQAPAGKGDRRSDAAALAGGSSWVFLGSLFEGAMRWVVNWYLSGVLGTSGFGIYQGAVVMVMLLSVASTVGVNIGMLFFGARWLHLSDRPRLKGYLLSGLGVVLITGPCLALVVAAMGLSGRFWQDDPGTSEAMALIAPAVAIMGLMLYLVFALRSAKEMMRSTVALQVVVPSALLVGAVVAHKLGFGLHGVIVAFLIANVLGLLVAIWATWWRFGRLLGDRAVKPLFELKTLLRYSLPQAVPAVIHRLNIQMDTLLLLALSSASETGIYRVAVGLVVMVVIPVGAVTTMFSPQVAALYSAGEIVRLRALLQLATRWLVIIVAPIYLMLVLEHRLILRIYEPEYMASAGAIVILCGGQAVHAVGAPAHRLIPMSGRSVLDMGLSLAAVCLSLTLNFILIPRYGGMGAATAGAITFTIWGVTRILVAWKLTGCQPFTFRTVTLIVGAVILGATSWLVAPADPWLHAACSAAAVAAYGVLVLTVGRTSEDAAMVGVVRSRIARMMGRAA
jgi:O-antigen/teichoic acid export membrane protein